MCLFLLSFSHHWSKVITLDASKYPIRVSKKTRFGSYFSRFLAFISLTTTFPFRRRLVEEATINLLGRWVPETEGLEILWRALGTKETPDRLNGEGALQGGETRSCLLRRSLGVLQGVLVPKQNFSPKLGFMSSDDR